MDFEEYNKREIKGLPEGAKSLEKIADHYYVDTSEGKREIYEPIFEGGKIVRFSLRNSFYIRK